MKNAKLLALYLAPVVAMLMGGTLSVTDLPTSGTLTAARINSRFAQVEAWGNGGIGDANIDSSEPLGITKIANDGAYYSVSTRMKCTNQTPGYKTQLPATSTLVAAFANCSECDGSDSYTVAVQTGGTTRATFAALGTSLQSATGLSVSVGTSVDVEVDVSSSTNSACAATEYGIEVTMWFKSQHVAM